MVLCSREILVKLGYEILCYIDFQGRVECEGPNNRLYDFVGNITLQSQKYVQY